MSAPRTYAVLDCARDQKLYPQVAQLGPLQAACLYEGRLAPEVRAASPFLVDLEVATSLRRLWLREGWGCAWGLFIWSNASLADLRRVLRHFILARLPDGAGPLLFRFWDPRVFRVYFPLVEPDVAATWFAGVETYMCEGEDAAHLLSYRLGHNGIAVASSPRPTEI